MLLRWTSASASYSLTASVPAALPQREMGYLFAAELERQSRQNGISAGMPSNTDSLHMGEGAMPSDQPMTDQMVSDLGDSMTAQVRHLEPR